MKDPVSTDLTHNVFSARKEIPVDVGEKEHNYRPMVVCLRQPVKLQFTPMSVQTHICSEDFEGI